MGENRRWSLDDLEIIDDPRPWIRDHPERFLGRRTPDGYLLAGNLATDALLLTGAPVTLARAGDWWLVACQVDWMSMGDGDPAEYFRRVVPLPPEAGPNSLRTEVLLGAFCEVVVTLGLEGRFCAVGAVDDTDPIWLSLAANPSWRRAVAFQISRTLKMG